MMPAENSVEQRRAALQALYERVDACRRCAIGYTRLNAVPGIGDAHAALFVVGEGPGENEDRQGAPFVGRAGELLNKMLGAIGLRREDVFISNTIKSRAILEENGRRFNRAPTQEETENCREYLSRELEILRPRVILALGAPAAKWFLGHRFSITRQRGIWYAGPQSSDLIVTFHPAYILRLTGGNMAMVKKLVWSDLQAVRRKLDECSGVPAAQAEAAGPQQPALELGLQP